MTVKELRTLLNDAPDDMTVMIMRDTVFGAFAFQEACAEESGITILGPVATNLLDPDFLIEGEKGEKVFCVLPHLFTNIDDDLGQQEELPSELN